MITVFFYELRRTLRSPWFYVTCLLLPALLIVSVKLPEFITNKLKSDTKDIRIIITPDNEFGKIIKKELENDPFTADWEIKIMDKLPANNLKKDGKENIILEVRDDNIIVKTEKKNDVFENVIKRAVESGYFIKILSGRGMNRNEILKLREGVKLRFIAKEGKTGKGPGKYIIMLFLIAFYISIMGYGELLAHRVMVDKENNFINILLLYKKPEQIFTGKMLSVVVGYLIYLFINFLLTLLALKFILGKGINQFTSLFFKTGIEPAILLLVFILFFISFLMYSSFYLLSGAIANNEEDLKGHSTIINFILITSLIISTISISTPEIGVEKIFFYIPPVTPFIMLKNILRESMSVGGIITGFIIIILCTLFFIKLASLKYKMSSLYKRS